MTRDQLQRYLWLQKNNLWLKEKIEELKAEAEGVSVKLKKDSVKSTSIEHDKMAYAVARMVDLQRELESGKEQAAEVLDKIEKSIVNIDPRLKHLIRRRYIDGERLNVISSEIGISDRQLRRLHTKAIELIW